MLIKTADLEGPMLNWAVAKCEGYVDDNNREEHTDPEEHLDQYSWWFIKDGVHTFLNELHYSTDCALGGPIIDRDNISTVKDHDNKEGLWGAAMCVSAQSMFGFNGDFYNEGKTRLIAAMRCKVASQLGDEVDIPDELCSAWRIVK